MSPCHLFKYVPELLHLLSSQTCSLDFSHLRISHTRRSVSCLTQKLNKLPDAKTTSNNKAASLLILATLLFNFSIFFLLHFQFFSFSILMCLLFFIICCYIYVFSFSFVLVFALWFVDVIQLPKSLYIQTKRLVCFVSTIWDKYLFCILFLTHSLNDSPILSPFYHLPTHPFSRSPTSYQPYPFTYSLSQPLIHPHKEFSTFLCKTTFLRPHGIFLLVYQFDFDSVLRKEK